MAIEKVANEKKCSQNMSSGENWQQCKSSNCKKGRKCCFVTSILLNLILVIGFITTSVYMCRYKSEACAVGAVKDGFEYQPCMCGCKLIYPAELSSMAIAKAEHLGCDIPTPNNNPITCGGGLLLYMDGTMTDEEGREIVVD